MKRKRRELTVEEHDRILANDPEYQARMAKLERQWAEQNRILEEDEKPLVAALTAAGWPDGVEQVEETRSVWDLVNTSVSYPHLVETLTDHITRPYHPRTKEGIARALAVKEAKGTRTPRVLMDELKKETCPDEGPNSYRWTLVNTLVFIGDSSLLDDVRELLGDPRYKTIQLDLRRLAQALTRRGRRKR